MNIKKSLIATAVVTGTLFGSVQSGMAADVSVTVKEIRQLQGTLLVSIFADKESYDNGKPIGFDMVKVSKTKETTIFKDLKDGVYAVKLIHDKNDNKKMDTNILGTPKEGYGFSNDSGSFGPASFEDAKFEVKDNTSISITLK